MCVNIYCDSFSCCKPQAELYIMAQLEGLGIVQPHMYDPAKLWNYPSMLLLTLTLAFVC